MLRLLFAALWSLTGSIYLSAQPYTFSRLAEDLVDREALTRADFSTVQSLRLPLTTAERAVLKRVVDLPRRSGEDPRPTGPLQSTASRRVRTEPGKAALLGDLRGPGMINQIHLHIDSQEPQLLRITLLRIRRGDSED